MSDERTPLLQAFGEDNPTDEDLHTQFCRLIGTRPFNAPPKQGHQPHPESLYCRAVKHHRYQNYTYMFTATLTNSLILSQVVLGATLTGLGASNSSHILVTIFGALNTVIAGLIAFLKSRGQPMRARMFRDDLERVVDEIENSATMWLGISRGAHGYDAIDTDDQVTVRGEVARLTRLYDKAVKTNTLNDPDMYSTGAPGDPHMAALRDKSMIPVAAPAPAPASSAVPEATPTAAPTPAPAAAPVVVDADEAGPATTPSEPAKPADAPPSKDANIDSGDKAAPKDDTASKTDPQKNTDTNDSTSTPDRSQATPQPDSAPAPAPAPPINPDDSPASSAFVGKHTESTAKSPQ